MHRNENKSDQLIRNRLREHSHPVSPDLWSRIHSGLKAHKMAQPSHFSRIKAFLQNWRLSSITTLTAGAAGFLTITLGLIYLTHTNTRPTTRSIVPSTMKTAGETLTTPDAASATVTRLDTVTRIDPDADPVSNVPGASTNAPGASTTRSEAPATSTIKPQMPSEAATSGNSTSGNSASSSSASSNSTSSSSANSSPESSSSTSANTAGAILHQNHRSSNNLIASANHIPQSHSAKPAHTKPAHNDPSRRLTIPFYTPTRLTLSAIPNTGTQAQPRITAHPLVAQSGLKTHLSAKESNWEGSKTPKNPANTAPFKRGVYVSLYASPDFPNHYYTWSYTVGVRASLQFSPRWSFTAGLEYARVNVPTQVVPPIGYGDTLHSFYFSNYEVPILFGYKRVFGRSELTINGGAILNLYSHQSTGDWTFNWPNRASYGAVLGVDYAWSLNNRLSLFGQPYGRYSISNNRSFIPAQRLSFGTLLGIRYRLF